MYTFFVIDFAFFMILGFFLQNVLPHEYGIQQPIYFLFTYQFWGCEEKENNLVLDNDINDDKKMEKEIQDVEKNDQQYFKIKETNKRVKEIVKNEEWEYP